MKKAIGCLVFFSILILAATPPAHADGTLTLTVNTITDGGEQPLSYAYLYLQDGTQEAPLERFFRQPLYIMGPSTVLGYFNASVPAGTYYIRVIKKGAKLGPPQPGDLTWSQTNTITITDGAVTDLGTKYAIPFTSAPITISGIATSSTGSLLPGRFVRAQTEPCIKAYFGPPPENDHGTNRCGPVKFVDETDANGNYVIDLRDPGTYYLYVSTCLGDAHQPRKGNPCIGVANGTITVNSGDKVTKNLTGR